MKLIDVTKGFASVERCLAYLEEMRSAALCQVFHDHAAGAKGKRAK